MNWFIVYPFAFLCHRDLTRNKNTNVHGNINIVYTLYIHIQADEGYTAEEIVLLRECCDFGLASTLVVVVATGRRCSEASQLKAHQVSDAGHLRRMLGYCIERAHGATAYVADLVDCFAESRRWPRKNCDRGPAMRASIWR